MNARIVPEVVTRESSLCLSFIAYHSVVYRRQRLRPLAPTLLAEPSPLQSNLLFGPIDGPLASIMFKFMRGKGGQAGADRVKLQKELLGLMAFLIIPVLWLMIMSWDYSLSAHEVVYFGFMEHRVSSFTLNSKLRPKSDKLCSLRRGLNS
ncbi:unnamed protein product [Oppiella nova]|uniref:Uncharacterized protein n=1 Tax=Oppiella nova TaxID=334625 RepID=A0A7R9QVX9_9ACAR|nr:unnamed protein product [Oppiella nova]CAG2177597.1 unnamed protein product [Oppiella nova]